MLRKWEESESEKSETATEGDEAWIKYMVKSEAALAMLDRSASLARTHQRDKAITMVEDFLSKAELPLNESIESVAVQICLCQLLIGDSKRACDLADEVATAVSGMKKIDAVTKCVVPFLLADLYIQHRRPLQGVRWIRAGQDSFTADSVGHVTGDLVGHERTVMPPMIAAYRAYSANEDLKMHVPFVGDRGRARCQVGLLYVSLGELERAEPYLRQGIALLDPRLKSYKENVIDAFKGLAYVYSRTNRASDANEAMRLYLAEENKT